MAVKNKKELTKEALLSQERRTFLSKSQYAVYMSPVMLSMVVDKTAYAASGGGDCRVNKKGKPIGKCP